MNDDIKLWHGDCLELMKDIPDKSVDAIICDLPYEVLNRGNKNAKWDKIIPLDKLWNQYCRLIKDNGAIVLFSQGKFTARLILSNERMWRYNLIWDKINRPTGFLNANRMPLRIHEDICVFYKSQPVYNPQFTEGNYNHKRGGAGNGSNKCKNGCYGNFVQTEVVMTKKKYPTSIIRVSKEHKKDNFFHPTQKPVALIEWLVKTYTNENELVLDNTMGSGTTGIACVNTNRKFIGIELDDDYYDIACKRVKEAISNKQLNLFF